MNQFPLQSLFRRLSKASSISTYLGPDDLLRDKVYRRLWLSILISTFGAQITLLALPLTAAVLLHASPTQMGLLAFFELAPYVLLSLPAGVWLDRVKKLPIYVYGELAIAAAVASVPIAWWFNSLHIHWLYVVGFIIGAVNTTAGTAAQIVLTQIVPRERLIEAHAKNALASSGAEVAGPATAGALIKLLGAPLALIADAVLLVTSATILRGIKVNETITPKADADFWKDLRVGLNFVRNNRILVNLALIVGGWQISYNAALVVQILFATRTLGLSEHAVGLSYVAMGIGTIFGSAFGNRISQAKGPGFCLTLGIFICGFGWSILAIAPANALGVAAFAVMLFCLATGGVFIFINFLALRQSVTPEPLLGRMTSTMRWLILIPAGPGALLGGWLGEHWGLREALGFSAISVILVGILAWKNKVVQSIKQLPSSHAEEGKS